MREFIREALFGVTVIAILVISLVFSVLAYSGRSELRYEVEGLREDVAEEKAKIETLMVYIRGQHADLKAAGFQPEPLPNLEDRQ